MSLLITVTTQAHKEHVSGWGGGGHFTKICCILDVDGVGVLICAYCCFFAYFSP